MTLIKVGKTGQQRVFDKYSPDELAALGLPKDAKCACCGAAPVVQAISYATKPDALAHYPDMACLPESFVQNLSTLLYANGRTQPPVSCVRIGQTFSCRECLPVFERALAKSPSWVYVDIIKPPTVDPVVSVL
jgi:hypothetical protein